ncbi:MAG: hypothetical protein GY946_26220 [bacterium]|nr:hypothetical protein [bacterium]
MDAPLPQPVLATAELLRKRGIRCAVVGPAARELCAGRSPRDVRLLCEARVDQLTDLPHAVAPSPGGAVRVGLPALVLELAASRLPVEAALRDATLAVTAIGFDPLADCWLDPLGGRADLTARIARPGGGSQRLAEPLTALATARLVAELDLQPTPELTAALALAKEKLPSALGARLRRELDGLLCARAAARGLALLRNAGLEHGMAPRALPEAAELVGRLPPDPVLRWIAWLRGGQATRVLARLRVPRERSRKIERGLALHPLDRSVTPRPSSVGKALRRLGSRQAFDALHLLREQELELTGEPAEAPRLRLAELQRIANELGEARAPTLVWSGRDVMEALGEPAGPRIGRALAYLADRVLEDPTQNTSEQLTDWLTRWKDTNSGAGSRSKPSRP